MRCLLFLIAVFMLSMPLAASAYTPDDALLKDYIGLTKALKANGVDPVSVDWSTIEQMCLGLTSERDKRDYNRCRFSSAINQVIFADDRESCREESQAAGMAGELTVLSPTAVTVQRLPAQGRSAYTRCMRDLGWKNTRTWQMGRIGQ